MFACCLSQFLFNMIYYFALTNMFQNTLRVIIADIITVTLLLMILFMIHFRELEEAS